MPCIPHLAVFPAIHRRNSNPAPWAVCRGDLKGLGHLRKWGAMGWIRQFRDHTGPRLGNGDAWRMSFATPTVFKSGDADLPLPIPRLCFQSWLNSWDEHAPCPFLTRASGNTFSKRWSRDRLVDFSQLRMADQGFYFDGHRTRERGFTGVCRLSVKPTKTVPEHRHILGTLARYSFMRNRTEDDHGYGGYRVHGI